MEINRCIHKIKLFALLLFIFSFTGLIGSLLFHNALVSINAFSNKGKIFPFEKYEVGNKIEVICSSENNWCKFRTINKLDECHQYGVVGQSFDFNDQKLSDETEIIQLFETKKIKKVELEVINKKTKNCILNSNFYFFYKIFPSIFEKITEIQLNLGTGQIINPLLHGETSISNIVKRFPVKYLFKPLMFFSSILMIIYWFHYNRIFNLLFNEDRIKTFYIFGMLSAFFLFLHVLFLGSVFESKILTQIRRSYIVFFLIFEVLAQVFLIRQILLNKELLKKYLNQKIIILKLYFVKIVCFFTFFMILLFTIFTIDSKFDYIVEWNYFLFLLLFYFLSFLLWRKS